jgi:pyruvate/2-oxoglutarate dehydrogenase complex dihydrolipoamide acyltransferase (E2) component
MSIFSKIKNAIFGSPAAAAENPAEAPAPTTAAPAAPSASSPAPAATPAAPTASPSASTPVDVAPILDAAVKKSGQKLDWRHSIVDLMKALGMDASLAERKELAAELGYTGDTGDSAKMNMWLHKALMKKLSENGGKVPADLLD